MEGKDVATFPSEHYIGQNMVENHIKHDDKKPYQKTRGLINRKLDRISPEQINKLVNKFKRIRDAETPK